ncbi:MAG TPA: hypothetical protein VL527_04750 [Dongiaceae bacterium]|nr:hypothetical protein [Dongiaceae bacterium]
MFLVRNLRVILSLAALGGIVLLISAQRDRERWRRKELAACGTKLGLQFDPSGTEALPRKFKFLTWLQRGDCRYAYNVFRGESGGLAVTIFDYRFTIITGSNKGGPAGVDHFWSVYVLELKTDFPNLVIVPQTWESRFREVFGHGHILFESPEFSRAFQVQAAEPKFAFDVCHPRMMEYLLSNRDLTVEIGRNAVAICFSDWLRPERLERNLERLMEIYQLLPGYLLEENGKEAMAGRPGFQSPGGTRRIG